MVALHPEGVDRNFTTINYFCYLIGVALHPEGVDRNPPSALHDIEIRQSPSTRRAWIEIVVPHQRAAAPGVALHPEGVDRNSYTLAPTGTSASRPPPGGRG